MPSNVCSLPEMKFTTGFDVSCCASAEYSSDALHLLLSSLSVIAVANILESSRMNLNNSRVLRESGGKLFGEHSSMRKNDGFRRMPRKRLLQSFTEVCLISIS